MPNPPIPAAASVGKLPLICLSGSGGGHVRQLLDLEPLWRDFPRFFVTEDTVLGRSLSQKEQVEFVPHFALGQMGISRTGMMIRGAWKSVWRSARIIARKRPDVVITTGAGSQIFVMLWARIFGAKVILIDSFARFQFPSKFARLAGRFAHYRIAQSAQSATSWKRAIAFDPLRAAGTVTPPKEDLAFATVGAILPFDRLAAIVVDAKRKGLMPERVVLQVGRGAAPIAPVEGLEVVDELPFEDVKKLLARAKLVICHGGTGSLLTALGHHCNVIAIARRVDQGDAYDDHQYEIIENFVNRGLIEAAEDEASLAAALEKIRECQPKPVMLDYGELINFIRGRLQELFPDSAISGTCV